MAAQSQSTEFHADNFQKEQILRRLRKRVIQIWNLQETDIDNLDPIVDLLLGACSVEFERTAQEINTSQARVLERLAHLMVPEVFTNARPAHGIIHAQAELPQATIDVEDQFSLEKEVQEGTKIIKSSIIFSPVIYSKIFDVSVFCQAAGNKITTYDNPIVKGENLIADGRNELMPFTLWLGLKVNNQLDNFNGLNLYFDWKNDPDKSKFLPLLSMAKFYLNDVPLKVKPGLEKYFPDKILSEFDTMTEIESHILHLYHNQFLTINHIEKLPPAELYPNEFATVFSLEKLQKLKEKLIWIKVRLPEGMSPQSISDIYCTTNCIPVMNRTIHTSNRPYALISKLNSIPLPTDDHFLSVRKVYSTNREFRSVSLKKIRDVDDGSYSLRQGGVARFDQRDASAMLNNLFDMLRDESAAFSAFGNFTLTSEIKSMEQILSRLQMHFSQRIINQSSLSHLLIYTKDPEDVYVEFWSTNGELANRMPAGKKPELLTHADISRESMILINATSGGKEPMNEIEKLHAYKYTLMTRNRIVTEEDIKAACFAELGDRITEVNIKKGVQKDLTVNKGFVRTLDVIIKPSPFYKEGNWVELCAELQANLERKKMFLTAVRVYTTNGEFTYAA